MQLTTKLLDIKKRQFDEIVKNVCRLRDLIQSDDFFYIEKTFRRALVAEYHACSLLEIATKSQIEYLEQLLTIEPAESEL
jgi:hypothetical protein